MSQARPVLCLRRAGAGARLTQTLLHFSNAKSRQCRLLLVASLSLANLSSNMAPPTFAEALQPVTIDPDRLGDLP